MIEKKQVHNKRKFQDPVDHKDQIQTEIAAAATAIFRKFGSDHCGKVYCMFPRNHGESYHTVHRKIASLAKDQADLPTTSLYAEVNNAAQEILLKHEQHLLFAAKTYAKCDVPFSNSYEMLKAKGEIFYGILICIANGFANVENFGSAVVAEVARLAAWDFNYI